ncbi:MAG: NADH-quinone oxidoreductase subunit C [Candidatus Odinarchaeota archaeon]
MSEPSIIELLKNRIGAGEIIDVKFKNNDIEVELNPGKIKEAALFFKQQGYNSIITIIPVELEGAIQLIYYLENNGVLAALKIKISCDDLTVESIADIMKGAENLEKEARDLYGLNFKGLKQGRIIMPDDSTDKPVMLKRKT